EVRITEVNDYNESIIINRSITLTSSTFIKPSIFADGNLATVNITVDNVSITNLNISFRGLPGYQFHSAISAANVSNLTIMNNIISAKGGISIFAKPVIDLFQTNSSIIANNFVSLTGSSFSNMGIEVRNSVNDVF